MEKQLTNEEYIEIGIAMGKREMLYYLQRAALSKGSALTLEDINKYHQVVAVAEMLNEVELFEGGVQEDMRLASTQIATQSVK